MPHPSTWAPPPSPFTPLVIHLATRQEQSVTRTLAQIEAIIGVPLSTSAHVTLSLWSGTAGRLGRDLRAIGRRAHLQVKAREVVFRRLDLIPQEQ
jgi:hypothetical protein